MDVHSNIPVYDFSIDNTADGHGVSVVSLVDFPAIQVDFIALSEDKRFEFKAAPDQQMAYGPLLVPGQLIYRNDEGHEYYMRFSAETIALIAKKFQKDNNSNSITVDHSGVKVDATISELWITGNPDKSQQFGFNLPVGTWFAGVHIADQSFWTDQVKTGNVKGFSVEVAGVLNHAKLMMDRKITKDHEINKEAVETQLSELRNKMNEIMELITEAKVELAATGMPAGKMADGTVVMTDTGKMVAGENAYMEDGTAMADGEYEMEDGTKFTVVAGVIDSVEPAEAAAPEEEEEVAPVAQAATEDATPNKMEEALSMMESKIQDILNRVSILEASMSMSADKIEALSMAPGAKSIKGRKEDKTIDNKKADFAEMVTKIQGITKQVNSKRIWS